MWKYIWLFSESVEGEHDETILVPHHRIRMKISPCTVPAYGHHIAMYSGSPPLPKLLHPQQVPAQESTSFYYSGEVSPTVFTSPSAGSSRGVHDLLLLR
jgi:hypothetical protein